MILLDTHIWVHFVNDKSKLTSKQLDFINENIDDLGVSVISCWEICKLVELKRLYLGDSLQNWFNKSCSFSGITLIDLNIEICIESTNLPGKFHRDPMDQIVVATARNLNCPLVTSDNKIIDYLHVQTVK